MGPSAKRAVAYVAAGADIATKQQLEKFLSDHGYRLSPVTDISRLP